MGIILTTILESWLGYFYGWAAFAPCLQCTYIYGSEGGVLASPVAIYNRVHVIH